MTSLVSGLSDYVVDHKNAEFVSGGSAMGSTGKLKRVGTSELGIWKKVQRGMAYWTVIVGCASELPLQDLTQGDDRCRTGGCKIGGRDGNR